MENLDSVNSPQVYFPEVLSRRGEFTAWILFCLVLVGGLVLRLRTGSISYAVIFLGVFLLLSGFSISLGNWMDRHTYIEIKPGGIEFANGLRFSDLEWLEIFHVEIHPSSWGDKVHVRGVKSHFAFRTLGEVRVNQEIKGRMGFKDGDKILEVIIERSNLTEVEHSKPGKYYERQR